MSCRRSSAKGRLGSPVSHHEIKNSLSYKTEEKALEMMQQEYGQNIPQHNLHFIMGTMASHPRTFIVIGLLRSGLDPEEVSKQGALDF